MNKEPDQQTDENTDNDGAIWFFIMMGVFYFMLLA